MAKIQRNEGESQAMQNKEIKTTSPIMKPLL